MSVKNEYSIKEAKNALGGIIRAYLAKDGNGEYVIPLDSRPCPILLGPPGVGKSECVKQTAIDEKIGFVSYSIVHQTRTSMLGLPVITDASDGAKYTTYTVGEIIAAVRLQCEKGFSEGILFLDEFPCISDTVAPVMLEFLVNRRIGAHILPPGWLIFLAGNTKEFNRSARQLDMAMLDRLRILPIRYDARAWIEFAEETAVSDEVVDFIKTHKTMLNSFDHDHPEMITTPRSWVNFARNLSIYEKLGIAIDLQFVQQFLRDPKIAGEYWHYRQSRDTVLNPDEMEQILTDGNRAEHYKDYLSRCRAKRSAADINLIVDTFGEYTVNTVEDLIKAGDMNTSETCLNNAFDFLDCIGVNTEKDAAKEKAPALSGRLSHLISSNKTVLRFVSSHDIKRFNELMMDEYDVPA